MTIAPCSRARRLARRVWADGALGTTRSCGSLLILLLGVLLFGGGFLIAGFKLALILLVALLVVGLVSGWTLRGRTGAA